MNVIMDGKLHVWRGSVNHLTTSDGTEVGALYSFLKTILFYWNKFGSRPAAAWEGNPVYRKALLSSYKGDRVSDDNVNSQMKLIQEMLSYLGVNQYWAPEYEADDVMFSYAKRNSEKDEVVVVTADSDLYQVISDRVKYYNPFTQKFLDKVDVYSKTGVFPQKIAFLKAIIGDVSDSVEGVKRLGRKYLFETVNKFDHPNQMFEFEGSIPDKIRDKILSSRDMILKNYDVVLLRDVEYQNLFEPVSFNPTELYRFLKKYEFQSFLNSFDILVQFAS